MGLSTAGLLHNIGCCRPLQVWSLLIYVEFKTMAPLPVTNGQFKFFWCKQDYKSGLGRPHSIFQFSSLWWNVCGGASPGQARQGGHNLQLIPSRNKSVQWGQCLSDLSRLISPHQLVTSVRFVTKSKSVSLPVLSYQTGWKEPEKKREKSQPGK